MGKRPKGTPGKKPPARFIKKREVAGPMTLGNMRRLGMRSLDVTCKACGHHATFNVDAWPDEVLVISFGRRIRCIKCGHLDANVMPDWHQLQRIPRMPRR
jgi:hypothetical protein